MAGEMIRSQRPQRRSALLGCAVLAAVALGAARGLSFAAWTPAASSQQQQQQQQRHALAAGRAQVNAEALLPRGRFASAGARRSSRAAISEADLATEPKSRSRLGRGLVVAAGAALFATVCYSRPAFAKAAVATLPAWLALPTVDQLMVLPLDKVFLFLSYFPVAYFLPLMFLPRWGLVKKFGKSQLPFLALGALYIYVTAVALYYSKDLLPFAEGLWMGEATLAKWKAFLNTDTIMGVKALYAWAGIKIANVFVGRYIYLDAIKSRTFAFHSMLACLCINGAAGYLLHLVTKVINGRFTKGIATSVDEEDPLPEEF